MLQLMNLEKSLEKVNQDKIKKAKLDAFFTGFFSKTYSAKSFLEESLALALDFLKSVALVLQLLSVLELLLALLLCLACFDFFIQYHPLI